MVIDVNGMEFHLRVSPAAQAGYMDVRIVDEAFSQPPLCAVARSARRVVQLLETYTGIPADGEISQQVATLIPQVAARRMLRAG